VKKTPEIHQDTELKSQNLSGTGGSLSIGQENLLARLLTQSSQQPSLPLVFPSTAFAFDSSNFSDSIVRYGMRTVHERDQEMIDKLQRENFVLKTESFVLDSLHSISNSKMGSK